MRACPSQKILDRLLLGELREGRFQEIAEHVEKCALCQERLERITADANQDRLAGPRRPNLPVFEDGQDGFLKAFAQTPPGEVSLGQTTTHRDRGRTEGTAVGAGDTVEPDGLQDASSGRGIPGGSVLGDYVVQEKIGSGGMGQVLKARHRTMDRIVALKILPPVACNGAGRI